MMRNGRKRLSTGEIAELQGHLVALAESRQSLVEGLRAAAEEASTRRLRRCFETLAHAAAKGQAWPAQGRSDDYLPVYLLGLVTAGVRAGNLPMVLSEILDLDRIDRELRHRIRSALAYPLLLVILTILLLGLIVGTLVPQLAPTLLAAEESWQELQLADPANGISSGTASIIWLSSGGWKYFVGLAVLGAVVLVLVRVLAGRQGWAWLWGTVPLVGRLGIWHSFLEFARLLRLLLLQQVPLDEALQLTSSAIRNPDIRRRVAGWSEQARSGMRLSDCMQRDAQVPSSLLPVVRWGEQSGELPGALQAVSEMLEGRLRLRTTYIAAIAPPVVFVGIAAVIMMLVASVFIPLFRTVLTFSNTFASF